jgi:trimeric autotransporter adhesin
MNIVKNLLQVQILLLALCAASGQMPARMVSTSTPVAASAPTVVPALVPYSGVVLGGDGKALSGEIAFTFLLFKEEQGGDPLWMESQTVLLDSTGHYQVQLGAGSPSGLPPTTFASGEGRWLEVQIAGQPPQSRVLLMSVPYAMKAADAATLGGLPASAYALAGPSSKAAATAGVVPDASSTVTTTGGTAGYVPEFSGAATIVDSPVFILGADVGIGITKPTATLDVNGTALISGTLTANGGATVGGSLVLPATGTATASGGFGSQLLKFYTSAYNSSTKAVVAPRFEWEAAVTGNNSSAPSATLNLLSSMTTAGPTETGFSFNPNGTINFAPGQSFPGGTGTGTITGVIAGTDLTGGGTSGNVTLSLNTSKIITGITAGSGLTGGGTAGVVTLTVDTTKIPTLTDSPTFTGTITANSKTSGKPAVAANGTSGGYGISAASDTGYAGVFREPWNNEFHALLWQWRKLERNCGPGIRAGDR